MKSHPHRPFGPAAIVLALLSACGEGGSGTDGRGTAAHEVAAAPNAPAGADAAAGDASARGAALEGTLGGVGEARLVGDGAEPKATDGRVRPPSLSGVDLSALGRPAPTPLAVPNVPSTAPTVAAKLLVVGSDTATFGEVFEGDTGEHVFDLRIEGTEPVTIFDQKSTCGCTVGAMEVVAADGSATPYELGKPIPLDATLRVHGALKTEGKSGENHHTITLRHNGSNRASLLHFQANVIPIFTFEPGPYLNFHEFFVNETRTTQIEIASSVVDAFALAVDTSFGLPPYLRVELEPVAPGPDGRAKKWIVRGTIGPDTPANLGGQQGLTVLLSTDIALPGAPPLPDGRERTRQLSVFTAARVKPLVSAAPAYLSYGAVSPGTGAERVFTIEFADGDFTPDLERLSRARFVARNPDDQDLYDELFEVRVVPVEGARKVEVYVGFDAWPEGRIGQFGGTVQIDVGHPTKPTVEVPFSGVSRTTPQPAAGR
jgi:hypothetical protein